MSEVWLTGGPSPDRYVDVTDTFGKKVAALRAHESQTGHMDGLEDRVRGWLARGAAGAALPDGRSPRRSRSSKPAEPSPRTGVI